MAGPETPFPWKQGDGMAFPLIDASDIAMAVRFGFCRDCPFPMKTEPTSHHLVGQMYSRELGIGSYSAHEIAGVVTITATGTVPNLNAVAQLVQLPLMIWPPRFALYFTNPGTVLPAVRPFKVEATLLADERLKAIVVQDKSGAYVVPVQNF